MSILSRLKAAKDAFLGKQQQQIAPVQEVKHVLEVVTPKALARDLPKKFTDWAKDHRKHQLEAIMSAMGEVIGQICLPTGTGKTRVQVHMHVHDMLTALVPGVYVITAHRLALCRQLLFDLVKVTAECGIRFDVVFVGSDNFDEDSIYERHMKDSVNAETTAVTTTTNEKEVRDACIDNPGRVKIVVSTYHSLHKLKLLERINLITYDEAHTIASSRVSEDNFEAHVRLLQSTPSLNIQKQFFFTATRKVDGDEGGMNDEALYGRNLGGFTPKAAVEAGEIVPPRIHRITTTDRSKYSEDAMVAKTIMEAFSMHSKAVREASTVSSTLGAKMLVGAKGTPMIRMLHKRDDFLEWCKANNIKLFTFSSELGSFMTDDAGVLVKVASRATIFDTMLKLGDEEKAILIHIDILTEGIDLPAITGVLLFRELNLVKLLQTIGRGARLLVQDRKALYGGTILPGEYAKMVKPYCWVILSDLEEEANAKGMEAMVRAVRDSYGTPTMQYSREDEYTGEPAPDLTPITPKDVINFQGKVVDLKHFLEHMPGKDVLIQEIQNITPRGLAL